MHPPAFLADLAIVLLVASVTGLVFRRLGQPSVLGYLVAGLIVGPYIPIPVFADPERTHALSELGVVLVMFVVGLELRLRRLVAVLPTAGVTTLIEVAVLLGVGIGIGNALGWDTRASLFLGASIAISSTMVVTNVFAERKVQRDVREHVMGVLVLQDVLAIVLAAVLTAVAAGQGLSGGEIARVVGRLGLVLLGMIAVGLLVVPRLVRAVVNMKSAELLVVVCMGLCFGLALAAETLGYSVALGAFLAGVLVAESGEGKRVEKLAEPMRDVFAAIFFVAIGMTVDPRLALEHLPTSLLVFACVVVAQLVSVSVAGVLSGIGLRRSVTAGLSLGQVGEFGFILSAIGIDAGMAPDGLGPIVVTVAVLTAFTTPLAVSRAERIVRTIDHWLPRTVQDLLSLYEAWFEKLRTSKAPERSALGRTGAVVVADGLAVTAIIVVATVAHEPLRALAAEKFGLEAPWDSRAVVVAAIVLATAPALIFIRATRALGALVAERVFDAAAENGRERPRRLLEVSVQLVVLMTVGIPAAVIALPFGGGYFALGLTTLILVIGAMLWRTAGRVTPQVQSSAARLVDLLSRQTAATTGGATTSHSQGLLGLDLAQGVALYEDSYAVGKTLAEVDLRAETGGTVLAIRSADAGHRVPTGREPLRAGDVLALAGSKRAIARAREFLLRGSKTDGSEESDDQEDLEGPET